MPLRIFVCKHGIICEEILSTVVVQAIHDSSNADRNANVDTESASEHVSVLLGRPGPLLQALQQLFHLLVMPV